MNTKELGVSLTKRPQRGIGHSWPLDRDWMVRIRIKRREREGGGVAGRWGRRTRRHHHGWPAEARWSRALSHCGALFSKPTTPGERGDQGERNPAIARSGKRPAWQNAAAPWPASPKRAELGLRATINQTDLGLLLSKFVYSPLNAANWSRIFFSFTTASMSALKNHQRVINVLQYRARQLIISRVPYLSSRSDHAMNCFCN